MITFIGIESLAANAIIELMRRDDTREVSFDMLVRYGMQIVRILEKRNGEEAVLLLSEKYQMDMLNNYSNFFEIGSSDGQYNTFRLKKGVSRPDLENYFRWTMTVRLFEAFTSPEAIQELGVICS